MRKCVIIFYIIYGNFLVSGVPLSQLLQTQTFPYNQNGYQDLNSLLQQALPQLYQQPTNNNLYQQQNIAQNALQPTNSRTNQLSQTYMDRILSSPAVQGILDSSSKYYSPVDTTNQSPKGQGGSIPQVINNYFILPPELLDLDEELLTTRNNDKRNADRRMQANPNQQRRPSNVGTDNMANGNGRRQNTNQNNGHNQRRGPARPQDNNNQERSQHQEDNSRRNNRRRPNDRQGNNDNRQMRERNGERRNNQRRDNNHGPQRKDRQNESNAKEEQTKINENENNTQQRKKEKQTDEDFIETFREQYPGIPDEAIAGLLTYLKNSHFDQTFDYSQLYNSHNLSYPLQIENFVPPNREQYLNNHQNNPRNRRPDRQRNNQRQRRPNTTPRPTQKTTPKPVPPEHKEPPKPTTQPPEIKTEIKTQETPQESKPETKIKNNVEAKPENKIESKPEVKMETTTTAFVAPALGSEDELPDVHNDLDDDDYYPSFVNDHVYLDSEEVNIIRNHRDNRYHYTTDRNERNVKIMDDEIENVIMKPTNSEEIEIIEYRTPPLLESPDFRTKQIKKAKPKSNELKNYDKSSNYSESKFTKDVKNSKSDKMKKSEPDIETVYAHSKVIKYGKNDDSDEKREDTPVVTYYLPENMQYEDDGRTVIVAKPIPADHFW